VSHLACTVPDDASASHPMCDMSRRYDGGARKDTIMLWTILIILLVLWVLGLLGSIGGAAVHLLLVLAAIVLIAQLLSGRRTV
jgi:fatty acid desaturase